MATKIQQDYAVIFAGGTMQKMQSESEATLAYRLLEFYDTDDAVILPWKTYWVMREYYSNERIYEKQRALTVKQLPAPHDDTQDLLRLLDKRDFGSEL